MRTGTSVVNFEIPDYFELGKSVSRGFGIETKKLGPLWIIYHFNYH